MKIILKKSICLIFSVFYLFFSVVQTNASTYVNTVSGYSYRLFPEYTTIKVPKSVTSNNEIVIKLNQATTETNRIKFAESVIELKSNEVKLANTAGSSAVSGIITMIISSVFPPTAIAGLLATLGYSVAVQNIGVEIKKYQNYANLYYNSLYPYRQIAPDPTCYFNGYVWMCPFVGQMEVSHD
jgi:hypothetical protein